MLQRVHYVSTAVSDRVETTVSTFAKSWYCVDLSCRPMAVFNAMLAPLKCVGQ